MENSCLMQAWRRHERELRAYLRGRLRDAQVTDDLLQDVFLKSLAHKSTFCSLDNARAWLFTVARNALADRLRMRKEQVELPGNLWPGTTNLPPWNPSPPVYRAHFPNWRKRTGRPLIAATSKA